METDRTAHPLPRRDRPRRRRFRAFRPFPRPHVGRRLPRELRAKRVGRLAGSFPEGLRDPQFEVLLRRIDGAPVLGGNRTFVFFNGEDAFAAMCEAVAKAEREVLLESYIFKDDETGRRFFEALAAAAARGVSVSLLADAVGSFSTGAGFWREMERRGIKVRIFNPLFAQLWYQPFRDHRKILVVDRRVGFTGGMNIGAEYGSIGHRPRRRSQSAADIAASGPPTTWRDTHVRVVGPTAWEMVTVFEEGWLRAGGRKLGLEPLPAEAAEAPGARILVLDARHRRGYRETAAAMAAVLGAARRTVWVSNAYFAPGPQAIRLFAQTARRGVDVRLLLQGKSDSPLVRHAGHGNFSELLRSGVRIFEYQPSVLHAKCMVADEFASVVGSTNLDFRSFVFNAECNLLVLDDDLGRRMADQFRRDSEQAVEVLPAEWERRGLGHKLGDRLAHLLSPVL
ncbi:MAG TPA: phospholipase D-like domain-containing protein [Solirubrobacterales bacterium]|nr:phospholipase D-like domain-containing protein [Solirubrobacterales bacterium]